MRAPSAVRTQVAVSVTSSTDPCTSPIAIRSPTRIGCVTASEIPEIALPIESRAANPTIALIRAPEASAALASRSKESNWSSARKKPVPMISAKTRRRTTRRRVWPAASSEATPERAASRRSAPRISTSTSHAAAIVARIVTAAAAPAVHVTAPSTKMPVMVMDASSGTGRIPPPRAVLLDALGTLVELDEPVPNLTSALAERGLDVPAQDVAVALRAEIAHYRAHHDDAVDEPSLERLRDRCAEVFQDALPSPAREGDPVRVREALLAGLRFRAFDEVPGVLRALRERGARLIVVSNWDVSLHGVLRETGLDGLVDGVLTSAEERIAKPDPEIFRRALALAGGVPAEQALHVGDDLIADVGGAQAAGITPVLVDRDGRAGPVDGVRSVQILAELLPDAR